jgi:pimeloyl-ACP methyl ester carboxylesterase
MPKIKVNDVNLYYEIHGKGEPVVFIAGFSADHLVWQNIIQTYSEKYQVLVFDNRGAGQSDKPNYPYTIDMMCDDTAALCKALGINSAHLIGNSMGGWIAQTIARKFPEFVKTAIITHSSPKCNVRALMLLENNLALREVKIPLETFFQGLIPTLYSWKFLQQEGIVDALIKIMMSRQQPATIEGYKNQLNAARNFDSRSWLTEIKRPCLIINADDDLLAAHAVGKWMASQIPNAEFYCFHDVGHLSHIEQPEIFNKVVFDFIAKKNNNLTL